MRSGLSLTLGEKCFLTFNAFDFGKKRCLIQQDKDMSMALFRTDVFGLNTHDRGPFDPPDAFRNKQWEANFSIEYF